MNNTDKSYFIRTGTWEEKLRNWKRSSTLKADQCQSKTCTAKQFRNRKVDEHVVQVQEPGCECCTKSRHRRLDCLDHQMGWLVWWFQKRKKIRWVGEKELQWWMRKHHLHLHPLFCIILHHKHHFAETNFVFCIGRFPCCVLLTNENQGKDKLSRAIN